VDVLGVVSEVVCVGGGVEVTAVLVVGGCDIIVTDWEGVIDGEGEGEGEGVFAIEGCVFVAGGEDTRDAAIGTDVLDVVVVVESPSTD
jgi:hypothetical protein